MPFAAIDYYVILTTGIVSKVADVVEVPTVVNKTMAQGTYRDSLNNFPQENGSILTQGPGWSSHPVITAGSAPSTPPYLIDYEVSEDDAFSHEPPRSLTWPESHWEFVTTSGAKYYTPTRFVASMSTDAPTI